MVIGLKRESGTECHTDGKIKPGRPRRAAPVVVLYGDSVGGVGGVNQGAGDLHNIRVVQSAVSKELLVLRKRRNPTGISKLLVIQEGFPPPPFSFLSNP